MSQEFLPSAPGSNNVVTGNVSGLVVQAQNIHGGVHQHQHVGSVRRQLELPYRAGAMPSRAASFQSRAVSRQIASGSVTVLTSGQSASTSVLSGLGGVGKTQIAVDYAETRWEAGEVDLLIWVAASSRGAIKSGYARLAADLTGIEDANPGDGAQRFREWLGRTPARWLVILDDLQAPSDLRELWPPFSPTGQTVVTTRRQDTALRGERRQLVGIDVFTDTEAHAYLQARLREYPPLLDGATALAKDLGGLPLALAQATAYMLDRNLSCTGYRERLADRRGTLATLAPETDALPDDHQATMAAAWSISIEHANQLTPADIAKPLLELASFLNSSGISVELFRSTAVLQLLSDHVAYAVTGEDASDGLGCLHRLSLITRDSQEVRVHSLVQRATRDILPPTAAPLVALTAAAALLEIWPKAGRDAVAGQMLRANATALDAVGSEYLWGIGGYQVLFQLGASLLESGLFTDAVDHFQRCHDTAAHHLGSDHHEVLFTRIGLAKALGETGDLTRAITASEGLLADQRRVLGTDHPDTLLTRSNLISWRVEAGDSASALTECEKLLADQRRVLGPDHPGTLLSRSKLATCRGEAGDPAGAVTEYERLLADQRRVLGTDHPDTLLTRSNLAHWQGLAGDRKQAVTDHIRLFDECSRVLGPKHPHTAMIYNRGALWWDRL